MRRIFSILYVLLSVLTFTPPAQADSLGVGVIVLPDEENSQVDFRSVIWFGVEPGDTKTRNIIVRSSGDITQAVSFSVFDLAFENGEEFVDSSQPGEISNWVTFSPANLILEPGAQAQVAIQITVPELAEERAFQSSLRVLAADGRNVERDDSGGFRAFLGGAAAIDVDLWLGVGDALSLVPSFEITDLYGVIDGVDKYLRVVFSNTGVVPLELTGSVEFSDKTFAGRTFGPYEYQYVGLEQGQQGFIDVPIDQEIQEGPWDIYVRASQGNIRESRVFTLDLTFRDIAGFDPLSLLPLALSILLAGLAVFGIRLLRAGRAERKALKKNEAAPSGSNSSKTPVPLATEPEIDLKVQRTWRTEEPVGTGPVGRPTAGESTKSKLLKRRPESAEAPAGDALVTSKSEPKLDDWAESLRQSLREVRADTSELAAKYKDVPTRKPRKPKGE